MSEQTPQVERDGTERFITHESGSENSDGVPLRGVTMNVNSANDFDDDPGI